MLIDTLIYLSGATRPGAHMVCCLFIIGQKKLKRLVLVSRGPFSPNLQMLLCLIRNKIEFAPPAITAETCGDALWFLSVPVIDRHYLQKNMNNDNCTVQTFNLSLYSTHISFCLQKHIEVAGKQLKYSQLRKYMGEQMIVFGMNCNLPMLLQKSSMVGGQCL